MRLRTQAPPLLFVLLCLSECTTVLSFVAPARTSEGSRPPTAVHGLARDLARGLGKMVGGSEWKQVPEAFLEGLEESETNARARNAKPMEALPPELAPDEETVIDAEVVGEAAEHNINATRAEQESD